MPGIINKKRLVVLLVFVIIVFLLLLIRIGYWTFYKGEWLQNQAEGQWTQDVPVSAQRGSILDRNGNVLAQSASADTVILRPKQISNADDVADKLSAILGMDRATVYAKATDTSKSEVWLKRQISREQSDQIQALDLDGVYFTVDVKRYYPNNDLMCQVLGFTSVDGEGLSGLEKQYNKYLAGKAGRIIAETDKNGRELASGNEIYVDPEDGYSLVLSVDAVIQGFLEKACKETYQTNNAQSVQGIVMDPNTGDILAMANIPGFDLNNLPRDDQATLEDQSRNRVTADVYEPGSTFKIITTASALDSGAITMDSTFTCSGSILVDGQKIKCWRTTPHGFETLPQAVQNSCNPCFVQMALNMGIDTYYSYLDKFGFGSKTGIDYVSDQAGLVVDQKYVKNVDLARIGFGQSIAVTPLQLITAVSAVINGGTLYEPHLVSAMTDADGNVVQEIEPVSKGQVISADTSANMRDILYSVVELGSGRNAQIAGYKVGGKTGTAQKYENGVIADGKYISSFIGFAPADDPKYVVLILVDEASAGETYGSIVAAPYVKDVLEQTLKYDNVPPTEIEEVAQMVTMPSVIGQDTEAAKTQLEAMGLTCMINGTGEVTSQLPVPNQEIAVGTEVILNTANSSAVQSAEGQNLVQVPDLKGMTVVAARDKLKESGFEIDVQSSGLAVRQTPAAGEYAEKGSVVTVYFALDLSNLQ